MGRPSYDEIARGFSSETLKEEGQERIKTSRMTRAYLEVQQQKRKPPTPERSGWIERKKDLCVSEYIPGGCTAGILPLVWDEIWTPAIVYCTVSTSGREGVMPNNVDILLGCGENGRHNSSSPEGGGGLYVTHNGEVIPTTAVRFRAGYSITIKHACRIGNLMRPVDTLPFCVQTIDS